MRIKQGFLLSLVIWTSTFAGCQDDEKSIRFEQYIPDLKHGKSELLEGARSSRDCLGLDNLEQGYDSLQIRIWFTYGRGDSFQVLSIKRNNRQWQGYFCFATFQLNETEDSIARYISIRSLLRYHFSLKTGFCRISAIRNVFTFPKESG